MHAIDQVAQSFHHLAVFSGVAVQVLGEGADARAVIFDDRGVERDHGRRGGFVAFTDQAVTLRLARDQCLAHVAEVGCALGDRGDQTRHRLVDLLQLRLDRGLVLTISGATLFDIVVVGLHQQRYRLGTEQSVGDAGEHALLDFVARDRSGDVTGARFTMARAAELVAADDHHRSTAAAAADETGEKMARAFLRHQRTAGATLNLLLHRFPRRLIDDAQLGHVDHDQVFRGVGTRDTLPALRIAEHTHAIVGVAPAVDGIVQEPELSRPRSHDGGGAPLTAAWAGDAFGVEAVGDHLWAALRQILGVDAADDACLVLIDLAQAAHQLAVGANLRHHSVAVGQPAGHPAALDRAALTASDLVCQILEKECCHRPLEADVQFVDGTLTEGDDLDASELQALVDRGDVSLVARNTVDRLGEDDIEPAIGRIRQHLRHAGSPIARAGDRNIGVDTGDFPAFARGSGVAVRDLIFGGVERLFVSREAGVDSATGHWVLRGARERAASSAAMSRAIARISAAMCGVIGASMDCSDVTRSLRAAFRREREGVCPWFRVQRS